MDPTQAAQTQAAETPVAQATAAQIPAATVSPTPAGTSTKQPPPGYKYVKVRQDGKIVTVKRKLAPGEEVPAPVSAPGLPEVTGASSAPVEPAQFKIVTIRKDDGTLVKVRRQVNKQPETTEKKPVTPKKAAAQNAEPTAATTIADSTPEKVTLEKATSTGTTSSRAASTSKQTDTKPNTGGEYTIAKGFPATDAAGKSKAIEQSSAPKATEQELDPKVAERELADALAEQAVYHRERRTHRFKASMLKGFGMAVGAALPGMEISQHFEDDDEIIGLSDDDDDYSVDDHDDDDGHDDDGSDTLNELHDRREVDDGVAPAADSSSSGPHISFDAGAAVGGLAATAAANAAAQPPPPPPAARAAQNGATTKSDPEKEKHTYKVTAKELADIEQGTTDKVMEKKLNRHWANSTFYFMASLSIILPALFLLLAIFIRLMNGRLVSSSWGKMEDAIKVAISAWPIVFAAVVAQCFKAYATFKVERGIKLMELEQLLGSSSFASAIKQPVLLRRLDLLTLALFAVWCLSPLGSQALLRVYTMERREVIKPAQVRLLPNYGNNRLLTPGQDSVYENTTQYSDLTQLAASYYIAALTPKPETEKYQIDRYQHPVLVSSAGNSIQAYGAFVTYPDSLLTWDKDDYDPTKASMVSPKHEELSFNMSYSYFNFTCDPWQIRPRQELDDMTDFMIMYSSSGTFGLALTAPNENSTDWNGIRLGSANNALKSSTGNKTQPWADPAFEFSYITCGFEQIFEQTEVICQTDLTTRLPICYASTGTAIPAQEAQEKGMVTDFTDFVIDFLEATNPGALIDSPSTLSELFMYSGYQVGGDSFKSAGLNMSTLDPRGLAGSFGYLFNTFLGIGYCPECVEVMQPLIAESRVEVKDLYKTVEASVTFANDLVYVINIPWLVGFAVCAGILVVGGMVGVVVESMTVAPDILGYVSTVARNSRYLQLPKTSSAMSGGERAKTVGGVKVMMQDVKGTANVGKIALGMKHENAQRLLPGRLYR